MLGDDDYGILGGVAGAADGVLGGVDGAEDGALGGVEGAEDGALGGVEGAEDGALGGVEGAEDGALGGVDGAADGVEGSGLESSLGGAVGDAEPIFLGSAGAYLSDYYFACLSTVKTRVKFSSSSSYSRCWAIRC